MDAPTIMTAIAAILLVLTLLDWRRRPGGPSPKRRAWLIVAAVFLGVSAYLKLS